MKGLKDQSEIKRMPGIGKPVFLPNSPMRRQSPSAGQESVESSTMYCSKRKKKKEGREREERGDRGKGRRNGGMKRETEGVKERKERRKVELTKIQLVLIIGH